MKKIIHLLVLVMTTSSIYAGGYRVALQGQKALAMGHAGVAIVDSAELAFFNPSGLVFLENRLNISAGVTGVISNIKYQNLETRESAESDNPISTPFYLYATYNINDWFAAGISINTPYGSIVEWPRDWAGSHLVNSIELAAIYINPIISLKLTPEFSIGGGPIYVNGSVKFDRNNDLTSSTPEGIGNVNVEATGVTNWGWVMSAMFKPSEKVYIGATYRSEIEMNAKNGDVEFTNLNFLPETKFNATLPLPAELSFGASVQINDKWLVTAEFNRAYWATYDSLDLDFTNPAIPDSFNNRDYNNSTTWRVGAQYDLNHKFILRGGYYYDESPVQSGLFSPETPRNDGHGFSTGFSYNFNERLALDLAFLYFYFDEIDESFDSSPDDDIPPFEGTFSSNAFLPGIGITYKL